MQLMYKQVWKIIPSTKGTVEGGKRDNLLHTIL